jgi:diaminopimelate decarboxylase
MQKELSMELAVRCFQSPGTVLHIGGAPVSALASQYGTPLFVYDRDALDRTLDGLATALPHFEIFYSVKANPNLSIVRHFVERGCGLEIASAGELTLALAAGCSPERIFFAGPGKTDRELELAIGNRVGEIHIESANEAARIASICAGTGSRVRVGVRVNPTGDAQGGAMRMGGKAAPFGVDEEELDSLIAFISSTDCFDFRGIHMFVGTQVLDCSVLLTQYRKAIELARRVVARIGRPLGTVDFGGGLGIPYFAGDQELDLTRLGAEVGSLMDEVCKDPAFSGTRFVIEPGRFLVGEAGVYLTRIIDIKQSRGKKFLIVDGGMNHHLAASGNLGQTIKRNYPLALVEKLQATPEETVDVVGPLCTPLDTLGRGVHLPKAEVGDLVGIFQSGAYARTASPLGFLSHDTPAEVWIDNGSGVLIRNSESMTDLLRNIFVPA